MFNKYDTDHNGALDKPELAAVAKELGSEFTSNELVAIFRLLDEDASVLLSLLMVLLPTLKIYYDLPLYLTSHSVERSV